MYYKAKWEQIGDTSTYRIKTPGDWVIGASRNFCYVPDPGHDWKFLPEEEPSYEQT